MVRLLLNQAEQLGAILGGVLAIVVEVGDGLARADPVHRGLGVELVDDAVVVEIEPAFLVLGPHEFADSPALIALDFAVAIGVEAFDELGLFLLHVRSERGSFVFIERAIGVLVELFDELRGRAMSASAVVVVVAPASWAVVAEGLFGFGPFGFVELAVAVGIEAFEQAGLELSAALLMPVAHGLLGFGSFGFIELAITIGVELVEHVLAHGLSIRPMVPSESRVVAPPGADVLTGRRRWAVGLWQVVELGR